MLVFDRENWPKHRPWALFVAFITLLAFTWCLYELWRDDEGRWPSGGSVVGLTLGTIGGVLIGFEMFLWPRKSLRRLRLGRMKFWMAAHIWLGLMIFPLLLFHGGFHFSVVRSPLAGVLMWLLAGVTLSGIFGLWLQNVIPKRMLNEVPAETIHSQIPHVLAMYKEQAEQWIAVARTGELPPGSADGQKAMVFEEQKQAGRVKAKTAGVVATIIDVSSAEHVEAFYHKQIEPFLKSSNPTLHPLGSRRQSDALFERLRKSVSPQAAQLVNQLEGLCQTRSQFHVQSRLHNWLHSWLVFHVALSVVLTVLMIVHIYVALRYH